MAVLETPSMGIGPKAVAKLAVARAVVVRSALSVKICTEVEPVVTSVLSPA